MPTEFDIDNTARGWDDPMTENMFGPYDAGADEMRFNIQTDLSIYYVRLLTPPPYGVGQTLLYEILFTNLGPDTAATAVLNSELLNLTITSVDGSECNELPCGIENMYVGQVERVLVEATIQALGAFDNIMTVTSTALDPNLFNNIDNTFNGGIAKINDLIYANSFE